jgi:DNA-binding NarL/FixJ family response regulator
MHVTTSTSDRGAATRRLAELGARVADSVFARRGVRISGETIRVVLADDHQLVREGLRLLLRTAPDIAVVGEASGGLDAVVIAQRLSPDVLVLDLDMPDGGGEAALVELSRTAPDVRVLVLTMHAEREQLLPLLAAGARGYLSKEAATLDLVEAVRVVASGEVYVRPAAARLLAAAVVPHTSEETARGRFLALSPREQSVLRAVAMGFSGVEISRQLGISNKTVDAYKRRIEDKLSLSHRTDYVRFGVEAGILTPAP